MKIGVLCPSEIAFRRFMPALGKCGHLFEYAGVAYASADEWPEGVDEASKAEKFQSAYGKEIFKSYADMLKSDIDCIYIPLPPALHFEWGKVALKYGKHVLMEKPFTTSLKDTNALLKVAESRSLAVHENYMFQYHSQIEHIVQIIKSRKIGDLRLIRIDFGFPFRGNQDFRYNRALGGGALLDCGGYTIKLASMLLGKNARLVQSSLSYSGEVDLFGSAVMANDDGITAQLSFGMDNDYRCNLDIWGSEGSIFTDRILTAPDGFSPTLRIKRGTEIEEQKLPPDDAFEKSIHAFYECIVDKTKRADNYKSILKQAEYIEGMWPQ